MKLTVLADGKALKLNAFISDLITNVMEAVVDSLKIPEGSHAYEFESGEGDAIRMLADGGDINLSESARKVVRRITDAVTGSLHGAEGARVITIRLERDK